MGRAGESDGVRVDYKGNMNAIENAGILGVTRMVLVTSVGAGDRSPAARHPRLRLGFVSACLCLCGSFARCRGTWLARA